MSDSTNGLALPCSEDDVDAFLSQPQSEAIDTLSSVQGDILVLGAGGKMGLHLCLLLKRVLKDLGKANCVWAASRFSTLNSAAAYERNGIQTLAGDFRDADFVEALPMCPTVFYLVGAKFGTSDNPELLHEINVEVAARLAGHFRSSKIIAFSTGCVYSYVTPESGGANEDATTNPVGEYARSCLQREYCFAEGSENFGTSVALIRLNYSVEFRYGVLVDLGQKVLDSVPIDVATGHVNVIWQNDALNQIVQTLDVAASPAVPINITGPNVVDIRTIARRFGKHFAKEPQFVGEEATTMWLSDASRSHRRFGRPSVDLETMVDWVAAWLVRGGKTYGKPTGFEKRDGKF